MSFIAIAGNMGVGKSELSTRLARRLGWKAYLEPVAENPYLKDFYEDMARWAFHSQLFFLAHRLRQHHELMGERGHVIQDRSVYENAEIYARNLHDKGFIGKRDWKTYRSVYEVLTAILPPPTLIVYLQASVPTLFDRISRRGRSFEQSINPAYLEELSALYEKWATAQKIAPLLTINTDGLNLVDNQDHLDIVVNQILGKLPIQQLPLYQKDAVVVAGLPAGRQVFSPRSRDGCAT